MLIGARKLRSGIHAATDRFNSPGIYIGAIQLLMRMADMPQSFKDQLDKGRYPNVSDSHARSEFINSYLPQIETQLREMGLAD